MIKKLLHASRNALLLVALAVPAVHAQESAASFPSKQVRIIVPFVAGGGTDQMARLLAQKLADKWGQRVIVENRPGGNTVIATQATARAAPDGYTMILVNSTFAINTILTPDLPYDSDKDFAAVAGVGASPFLMVAHPSVPANNFKEMMALLKAGKPGDWNFATVGSTGIGRIAGETFAQQTGVQLQHIPFKGAAEVVSNVVSGNVKFTIDPPGVHVPQVKAGKLKAYAVTGATRLPLLPDVPTFAEVGMPEYDVQMWFGLLAPGATPKPILNKLSASVLEVLKMPEVQEKLRAQDVNPIPPAPEQFADMIKTERQQFAKIIKAANIKAGE
ncbi:MAG: Bug family tripartite tricarboxylate transporter substrate binding protein [Burkholderiales bacterium]